MNSQRTVALGLSRARLEKELFSAAFDAGIRHLDTAYNYGRFQCLDRLGELRAPQRFAITSKVGFLPSSDGSGTHTLDPSMLYSATEDSARRLGAPLDTILLHNPEEGAAATSPSPLAESLEAATEALARAVHHGLAHRWGISVWRPHVAEEALRLTDIRPDVFMTRAGLSVSAPIMAAARRCRDAVAWPGIEFRGMAPLGGSRATRLLHATDLTPFVDGPATNAQAALRVSFELPEVSMIALGTNDPAHLHDAMVACDMEVDAEQISMYCDVLSAQRS